MSGRTILNQENPVTQSVAAIKALLAWKGRAGDPLPQFVELGKDEGKLVLVLSNKRDAYYCVTPKTCSCPAQTWHPGTPCKHQRRYFAEQIAKPAAHAQVDGIRPDMRGFRPVDSLPSEERAASSWERRPAR